MAPPGTLGDQNNLKSARAGRASRAGARAGRIVRIVRMIKLYKYASARKEQDNNAKEKEKRAEILSSDNLDIKALPKRRGSVVFAQVPGAEESELGIEEEVEEDIAEELPPESHVGAAMSDITARRVIILVLSMLIIIPLLNYTPTPIAREFGVHLVHTMTTENYKSGGLYDQEVHVAVNSVITRLHALQIKANGVTLYESDNMDKRRHLNELVEVTKKGYDVPGIDVWNTEIVYDYKKISTESAEFGIWLTLFVLFLLVVGTFMFSSDVNRLVINPIERMVQLVQKISKDPLGQDYGKVKFDEDEGFIEGMETTLLLQTITKIGSLMRVGFGEAGASVIANVLSGDDGNINLIGGANGRLIHSIFGFCDVRSFTDITECLQEEVMLFVNRIAHILHSIVVQCQGSANKNIGDAFLLTWKIEERYKPKKVSELADNALLAFCHALIELCRYQDFIMNFSVQATNRLHQRNLTKCRIGSGLHVGWAIEGAIGSPLKIDASYLSPHVNMSEYLESSTKAYGVPLLLSEAFYRLLTPSAQKWIRQVDRVRRSENEEPFGLFTYDSDLDIEWTVPELALMIRNFNSKSNSRSSTRNDLTGRKEKRNRMSISVSSSRSMNDEAPPPLSAPVVTLMPYVEAVWETDEDIVMLRHHITDSFRVVWKEGIASYIKGDWQKARDIFHETLQMSDGQDGPSKFLVGVIDSYGGSAPQDWQGYREV